MRINMLLNPGGLYVLTNDGRLGSYDEQKRLHLDEELTAAFREHTVHLLKRYLGGGAGEHVRLGFICPTQKPRTWNTATMFLDETVVRRLYPTSVMDAPLTVFQKRNQEKSIYRGLELLLEYRNKEDAAPVFCPVLFDAGKMLNDYRHCLGRAEQKGDADTPVIEVINLIDGLPASPLVSRLLRTLHTSVVRKDKRRKNEFTLLEVNIDTPRDTAGTGYEADARAERGLTLSGDGLENLHVEQNFSRVERWLEIPHRAVAPGDLRRFLHFRELNGGSLNQLAAKTLLYTAPAGEPLLECGMTDQWNMYLLEGTLMLTAEDGQAATVVGGSPQAAAPIAFLKPRKYKVASLTKVSFLWVHDLVLRTVRNPNGLAPQPISARR